MKRIDILPDDVLLGIFDFYVDTISQPYDSSDPYILQSEIEEWQLLVQVCRRWRSLVLGSPHRLNLRLYCGLETPAKDALDVWPPLPLIVCDNLISPLADPSNVFAALEQSNRVCQVDLELSAWGLEVVASHIMQVPFPELTDLRLSSNIEYIDDPMVVPDSFLSGSVPPRLRILTLDNIPFPGLPKLLSSATHLVHLYLRYIPPTGYISPEAMAALVSSLSSLRILCLKFQFFQYLLDRGSQILPPPKRFILPALDEFLFTGDSDYFEDFVTFIDARQLDEMHITFFNQIHSHYPRLARFINRTSTPSALYKAQIQLDCWNISVALLARSKTIKIEFLYPEPSRRLSSVIQICNSSLDPLSAVEDLYIGLQHKDLVWEGNPVENTLWLQILLPFIAVKNLYLSKGFMPSIAATLHEVAERGITEVLPSLQNIFVEGLESSGPFHENIGHENIGQFVTARQLSGRPVAISVWSDGEDE